jgi:hypothetical protein
VADVPARNAVGKDQNSGAQVMIPPAAKHNAMIASVVF